MSVPCMVALTLCIRRYLGVAHMLLVVTVVVWKWDKGLPTMMTTNDDPASLRLPNDYDSTKWNIQRMGLYNENVGIGFWSPPDGSQNNEITFQTNQSNTFAAWVNTMCLSPPEAWILYTSIYKPKVFYSCKISTFRETECMLVMRLAIRSVLPKLGLNCNTSRQMAFGAQRYGGIGIFHWFANQGAEEFVHLQTKLRWGEDISKVIFAVLSQLQLLSGWGTWLLEIPTPIKTINPGNSGMFTMYCIGITWKIVGSPPSAINCSK